MPISCTSNNVLIILVTIRLESKKLPFLFNKNVITSFHLSLLRFIFHNHVQSYGYRMKRFDVASTEKVHYERGLIVNIGKII